MQKIHTYTLLLIATLTPHLYPTQATAPPSREIQLATQLDTIQHTQSFKDWHRTRRNQTKTTIAQQVLKSHQLDIPEDILNLIADYTLSTTPNDPQLLEEIIDDQPTHKLRQIHNLFITYLFIEPQPQYRNLHDCFILFKSPKIPCDTSYSFTEFKFKNCYSTCFDVANKGQVLRLKLYHTHLNTCTLTHLCLSRLAFVEENTLQNCLIENLNVHRLILHNSVLHDVIFSKISYEDDAHSQAKKSTKLFIAETTNENTVFDNCRLKAMFRNSTFDKVHVRKTYFPDIEINHCTFSEVIFENCSFDELQCGTAGKFQENQRTTFTQCTFRNNTVKNATFINAHFIDCTLDESFKEATFIGCTKDEKTIIKSYPLASQSTDHHTRENNETTTAGLLALATYTCCQII